MRNRRALDVVSDCRELYVAHIVYLTQHATMGRH